MSIATRSAFYYGHVVDVDNFALDFSEGGAQLSANLNPGSYSLTEFTAELQRAINAAGALNYTVTVNRTTRAITISSSGEFELLLDTGTRKAGAIWSLAGFTQATDLTGAALYTGATGSGSVFRPQSIMDDYIPKDMWKRKLDAVVNESAAGIVQSITFGDVQFYQMNIVYQNNRTAAAHPALEVDVDGITNLRDFMEFCITKATIEFMPNRDAPNTFDKLILDATPASQIGTEYVLQKLEKVAGFYSSGPLRFRVVTT